MERSPHLKPKPYESSKSHQLTLVIIIVLFHVVGITGFCIPSLQAIFLKIVPWHLLLMLVIVMLSHRPLNGKLLLFTLLLFISGFFIEWIGVHTSWLFGTYSYGNTLGIKLNNIPLTISINWFLLIYSTGVFMQLIRVKNIFTRVITGALILVLLDVLIEPVAMKFDYWHWAGNVIPIENYACWFLVSALMLYLFERFDFKKQSIVAPVFLLMQFLFFIVLRLI